MDALDASTIELAERGSVRELRTALVADPGLALATGPGEETLLHIAARQWPKLDNGAEVARLLIEAGADVNAADSDGLRPIQGATGDPELALVLLGAGAATDVYAANHMHMSPAEVCLYYGLKGEARLLVDHGAPIDLRVAAGIGDLDLVRSFLGSDGAFRPRAVGLPDQPGPRPSLDVGILQALSYAARNGNVDVIELLLHTGADIDALVPHFDVGCTPLHQAVTGGHADVVELLVARGARLDVQDDQHRATALEWAEHQGKDDLAAILRRGQRDPGG